MVILSNHLGPRAKKVIMKNTSGDVGVFIELSGYATANVVIEQIMSLGALRVRQVHNSLLLATIPVSILEKVAILNGVSFVEVGSSMI